MESSAALERRQPAPAARHDAARRPLELTSFIGRDPDLAAMGSLIGGGHRLITITGPGGVGKTRLALAVLAASGGSDHFPDGDAFVSLAPIADPALVIPTIARSLGVVAADEQTGVQQLAQALCGRRMLLAVDNMEHVVAAAPQLGALLRDCAEISLLVTSRRALRLTGEQEYPLQPLPTPSSERELSLDALAENPAVALFLARARAANPSFSLTAQNAPAIALICARLDGLPLALELAAARVKLLSPQALAARLSHRLQLLTTGPRDLPARQQTLRGAVAWSYDLLTTEEATLFRRLAVFAGGATLDAIEAVARLHPAGTDPEPELLDGLDAVAALADHSLIVQDETPNGETRFRMLETIREFALERLVESGEAPLVRDTHAQIYLRLAERAAAREYGPDEGPLLRALEPEIDNLRAALNWLLVEGITEAGHPAAGLRLANAMVRFWDTRGGYLPEEAMWLQRALGAVSPAPTAERAFALTSLGVNAWFAGQAEESRRYQEQALEIWRKLDDPVAITRSLWFTVLAAAKVGDVATIEALAAESRPFAARFDDVLWKVVPAAIEALLALMRGDYPAVARLLEPAAAFHQRHGYWWPLAWCHSVIAESEWLSGNTAQALAYQKKSLTGFFEHGDIYASLDAVIAIAAIAADNGQPEVAARLLGAVQAERAAIGRRVALTTLDVETVLQSLATRSSESEIEAGLVAGRRLTPDDGVREALAFELGAAAPVAQTQPVDALGLSPREHDVLRLLIEGKSNQEIGESLFISPRTAGTHVANILAKLGVNSRTAAVSVALGGGARL